MLINALDFPSVLYIEKKKLYITMMAKVTFYYKRSFSGMSCDIDVQIDDKWAELPP